MSDLEMLYTKESPQEIVLPGCSGLQLIRRDAETKEKDAVPTQVETGRKEKKEGQLKDHPPIQPQRPARVVFKLDIRIDKYT
jgi:hypothetical protein